MPYSNNWLRNQAFAQQNPTKLPPPDPAHGTDTPDAYPSLHEAPPGADYGDATFAVPVDQAPGLVLDTPADSHDSPHRAGGTYPDELTRQMLASRAHDGTEDRGWVRQAFREPALQDDTTRYLENAWDGSPAPDINPVVTRRGINGLADNNPAVDGYDGPGFRRGVPRRSRVPFVDRKQFINQRVHTAQQLVQRSITVPANQPAQDGKWGRTSPFASLARNLRTVNQLPEVWTAPPDFSETVIASSPAADPDSQIATDGMWTVV